MSGMDNEHFICTLREHRHKAGLSQDELAALVKVRRETISRLEAAKYNPSLKLAVDIARTLDVPIETLFIFI